MRTILCILFGLHGFLAAAPRTSAKYSAAAEAFSAGARAASASYTEDGSIEDIGGVVTTITPAETVRHGFIGQLYDTKSLEVSASPASVVESHTTQLSAVATMDDGSKVLVPWTETSWLVVSGPVTGISTSGLATAGEVFINAPATVRGGWSGVVDDLEIVVINDNSSAPGDVTSDPAFTPLAYTSTSQTGTYQGIIRDSAGNVVGALTGIKLLSTRTFSGKVIFNGVTYSLSGTILPDGSYSGSINRTGKLPLTVTLHLGSTGSGAFTLQALVVGDGVTGTGLIAQAPYSTSNLAPATLSKSYTFLLPSPQTAPAIATLPEGDGYGSAKVSTAGVISASGKTGDGVAFTTSGYLTADKQWAVFQLLYSSKGQIAGTVSFRDVPGVSDLDGRLKWVKNPNAVDRSYPLGFALAPSLVGSLYSAPVTGQRAITSLASQNFNARLTLAGTVVPQSGLSRVVTWLSTNTLKYYGPETLTGTITASTGVLSGSYYEPALKLTIPFSGAVLQKQSMAGGCFLTSYRAGYLLIEPGTGFHRPGTEGAGALRRVAVPSDTAAPPTLSSNVFTIAAAGTFGGILTNGGGVSGGLESVVITSTGALSGTVIIEGKRYSIKGTMAADGTAHLAIARTGLLPITADLQLAIATSTVDGYQITGQFSIDGVNHTVEAQRYPVYTKTIRSPQEGKYTVAMRAPDAVSVGAEPGGDGYATMVVDYLGNHTGTLTLADGTTTTFYGRASRRGEWSLHRSLYGTSGGYVAGKLAFRNVAGVSDLDGRWRWVKPAGVPKTTSYAAGFNTTRSVVGCLYTAPVTGARAMSGLSNERYNTWLRFTGPDMSTLTALTLTSLDRAVTWDTANVVRYYGPESIPLTFTTSTGLLTGTCTETANGLSFSFGGVLLQKQSIVTGRYTASGQSGLFTVAARAPVEALFP